MASELQTSVLLLVEDNPADADDVKEMLAAAGEEEFEVVHAAKLADALKILEEQCVDVVLLDLRLSDAQGTDGVTALLNTSKDIPVVVLTGMDDETLALKCIDAGAQDYLNKNELQPALLRRTIGYAVARLRETQLRELRSLLENYRKLSSGAASTQITAALAGVGSVRERHADDYNAITEAYSKLLCVYLDQLGFKKEKPKEFMESLITRIGDLGGGPRDLIDIHVGALDAEVQGASVERARALVLEGRLLALEMMGLLVDYYRTGNRRRLIGGDT